MREGRRERERGREGGRGERGERGEGKRGERVEVCIYYFLYHLRRASNVYGPASMFH